MFSLCMEAGEGEDCDGHDIGGDGDSGGYGGGGDDQPNPIL